VAATPPAAEHAFASASLIVPRERAPLFSLQSIFMYLLSHSSRFCAFLRLLSGFFTFMCGLLNVAGEFSGAARWQQILSTLSPLTLPYHSLVLCDIYNWTEN